MYLHRTWTGRKEVKGRRRKKRKWTRKEKSCNCLRNTIIILNKNWQPIVRKISAKHIGHGCKKNSIASFLPPSTADMTGSFQSTPEQLHHLMHRSYTGGALSAAVITLGTLRLFQRSKNVKGKYKLKMKLSYKPIIN